MRRALPLALLITACDADGADSADTAAPKDCTEAQSAREAASDAETAAAASVTAFTWELYAAAEKGEQDFFVSPFSVVAAVGMAYGGAQGNTATQMSGVLHVGDDPAAWHAGLGELVADLEGGSADPATDPCAPWQVAVANAAWGDESVTFESPWLALLEDTYGAPLQPADFAGDPEGERVRINAWVAENTAGHIDELFSGGAFDPDTRLVLVNAVYFYGAWDLAFDEGDTADAPFTTLAGASVTVPMMRVQDVFDYVEVDGAQVVALPYRGGDLEMVVVLPTETDGLPAVEAALTAETVAGWLAAASPAEVDVRLPRFETRTRVDLTDALAALGMTDALDETLADFGGIASDTQLDVGSVVHEAWISVSEEGTEAAAATGAELGASDGEPVVVEFVADHAFLYFVRDTLTGAVLFVGREAAGE